jgi:twitching motility protein PilU
MDILPYMKLMADRNASDLFLNVGSPVRVKIEGKLHMVGKTVLTGDMVRAGIQSIMNDHQKRVYAEHWEVDFAHSIEDPPARFRANVYRQRGEAAMVMRLVPSKIATVDELGLPAVLNDLIMQKRGLILMVGATGSGKSTTMAAMLRYRNENSDGHILTIEDPIEFTHSNERCIVSQREVGTDTLSYENALRSSMREAPDVILIGEIRDRETMEAALRLCNTGHLCVSTLHANNANQALERSLNLFPQNMHHQILMDLSLNVRAIISQRLVNGRDNKRCAAIEIMINTPHIADLIMKGELSDIKQAMKDSGAHGAQTFDRSLLNLVRGGKIEMAEAIVHADSRADLESSMHFGGRR